MIRKDDVLDLSQQLGSVHLGQGLQSYCRALLPTEDDIGSALSRAGDRSKR